MNVGLDYGVLRARPDRTKHEDDGSARVIIDPHGAAKRWTNTP